MRKWIAQVRTSTTSGRDNAVNANQHRYKSMLTIGLVLVIGMIVLQGCGNGQELSSAKQRTELMTALEHAGVNVSHVTNVYRTQRGAPPWGQGFILSVRDVRGTPEVSDADIAKVVAPVIRTYLANQNLRYEYVLVSLPNAPMYEIILTEHTQQSESTDETPSRPQISFDHYTHETLSFDYPSYYAVPDRRKLDVEKVREMMEPAGIEVLTILTSPDMNATMQLVRTKRDISFEALYQEKKQFSDEVNKGGGEHNGTAVQRIHSREGSVAKGWSGSIYVRGENKW